MRALRNLFPDVIDVPPLRGVAVFIVGEQLNTRLTSSERHACTGAFMTKICRLAGFDSYLTYVRAASMRRNLFRAGEALNAENAVKNAELLLTHFAAYQAFFGAELRRKEVLLCGAWARQAFRMRGAYGRQTADHGAITWIPHPSGRNQFYNSAAGTARVAELVRQVFAHAL